MICPECKHRLYISDTRTIENNYVSRQRYCPACKFEFMSIELPASDLDEMKRKEKWYEILPR